MRYKRSKSEATIGSLWKAQTKNAKIDHFTKNLSSPSFFKQLSSNFHKKSIIELKKKIECRKFFNFEKKIIKKIKTIFFVFFI